MPTLFPRLYASLFFAVAGIPNVQSGTVSDPSFVPLPQRIPTLETALRGKAQSILSSDIPKGNLLSTGSLSNAALAVLATGGDPAQAQQLLNLMFSAQDMDKNSPTYGSISWYYNSDRVQDDNSTDFACQALGPLYIHYRNQLTSNFLFTMRQRIRTAIPFLEQSKPSVTYTNMRLMNTVNLLLLGQIVSDDGAIAAGKQALQEWLDYTKTAGIAEYNSPTYAAVSLDSLLMGLLYSTDNSVRTSLRSALEMIWTDIKANYFSGREDLSGAHSRDYDFLEGSGGVFCYLWLEGLKNSRLSYTAHTVDVQKVYSLENGLSAAGYHPNVTTLPVLPKSVFNTNPKVLNSDRSNFVTTNFALGSASANYGPQDKLLNLELASTKDPFPTITIVPDKYDAPYGDVISHDKTGHPKPTHLPLSPASVQKAGMLLTILDLDPSQAGAVSSLATNVLLPAFADSLSVNGKNVDLTNVTQIPVDTTSWIGVREGQTGALIRCFAVDALGSSSPKIVLQSDANGIPFGAARITIYHYSGNSISTKTFTQIHLKVAFIIVVYRCVDDATWSSLLSNARSSQLTAVETNGNWQVQAQFPGPAGGSLQITRSLDNRKSFTRIGGGR
jgi:hypothetical protein